MRFHRLALSAIAFLAISTLSGNKGIVFADDDAAATPTTTTTTDDKADDESQVNETYTIPEDSKSFEFQAEVNRMLDIVVNSLYQNKDVFLRELISNASDALDKIRFLSIERPELLAEKEELEIRIEYDEKEGSLTVTDSGIGMTHDDLVNNLGTVARSGTTRFLEALEEGVDIGTIGMFGVGFYSSFLVAERVRVASKHPDDPVQNVWESKNGEDSFHIYDDPRGNTLGRGTEITLYLKEDALNYCGADKLKNVATFYSEFINHPIHLRTTTTKEVEVKGEEEEEEDEEEDEEFTEKDELEVKEDEEEEEDEKEPEMETITEYSWDQLNTNKPIWTRDKDEISDDEYQAFWKVVSKEDFNNATSWIHFNAEGNINFKSILYLPSEIPAELRTASFRDIKKGIVKLYVKKVLISDEFELLPPYLSFVKGVVDSDDLPLNVNRETLQESKIIKIISKKLARKVIEMIRKLTEKQVPKAKEEDEEEDEVEIDADGNIIEKDVEKDVMEVLDNDEHPYITFYKKFGPSLKFGVLKDDANRMKLAKLLRFKSSKAAGADDWVSLDEYIERMQDWQTEIYYLAGVSVEDLEGSHFLGKFRKKDAEVLYFVDPLDEYMMNSLPEYEGKKFASISKDGFKFPDEDKDLAKRRKKAYDVKFKPLTKYLTKTLAVMRSTVSERLENSPAVVSSGMYGQSANMERILKAQAFSSETDMASIMSTRILEINPRHPLITKLLDLVSPPEDVDEEDFKPDNSAKEYSWMLYDMALLNSGYPVSDIRGHSKRITNVLQSEMNLGSLDLEDEIEIPEEEESDEDEGNLPEDFEFDDLEPGEGMDEFTF